MNSARRKSDTDEIRTHKHWFLRPAAQAVGVPYRTQGSTRHLLFGSRSTRPFSLSAQRLWFKVRAGKCYSYDRPLRPMSRAVPSLIAILVAILFCQAATAQTATAQFYQGASLGGFADVDATLLDESILDLRQVGANTVAIDLNWSQVSLDGNPTTDSIAETLNQVTPAINAAQQRGLDVFLRSNVEVESGAFSGLILPSSGAAWFSNYGQIIDAVADFATEQNVALLSIGSNLQGLEAESFSSDWQSLIGRVRDRYTGQVTYSADFREDIAGGYREVPWWNELDVVGVNAFPPLTFDINAIPLELNAGAEEWADDFEDWLLSEQPNKQLIFTSTGYRSANGGSVFPIGRDGDQVDLEEQANAYNALLSAFESREWWGGSFWTGWDADPQAGGAGDNGFTPQNKPAEAVLAESFGGEPTFLLRPSLLESWEQGLNGWTLPNSGSSSGLSIESVSGITDGQQSLDLRTSATAARLWTLDGSEAYTLLQEALAEPGSYRLQLDVSLDAGAATSSTLRLSLMDDSEVPNVVNAPVNFEGATGTVEVPLSQFGDLNSAAIFYELHLSTSDTSNDRVLIDNLRLVSTVEGDVTNDAVLDCNDIDALSAAVRLGWTDSQFDLNADGIVDNSDRTEWMSLVGTLEGDFDLNGEVEFADFLLLSNNFSQPGNWCSGDATGDREVDFADFLALSTNFGTAVAADSHSVPEPRFSLLPVLVLLMVFRNSFRR